MEEWAVVFKNDDVMKAEILKGKLLENGIDAVVINKKDTVYPVFGVSELRVMPKDFEIAHKIITDNTPNA